MKTFLRLLFILSVGVVSNACIAATDEVPNRTPEDIEKLVSPIALYPDSLVAIILPASTESSDVVLAARFLSFGGKEADIEKQFWHDTVKSLAHYPDLVKWMDENLDWTQQMGEVFATQPTEVMAAIQRLRAHAQANGLLVDTPQQRVVVEQEVIYIVPASPDYIYIPRYDPDILWMRSSFRGPFLSFSVGFGVGNWLFYDCDWPGRTIWVHRRQPGWVYTPFWRPPPPAVRVNAATEWHPSTHYFHRDGHRDHRSPAVVVVPRPFGSEHQANSSGPDRRDQNRQHEISRPTPPAQRSSGRPPATTVAPITHMNPAPTQKPQETHSSQQQRTNPTPSVSAPGATTLRRPTPPAQPTASATTPAPSTPTRPSSTDAVPQPSSPSKPSAPPAKTSQPSNEKNKSSDNSQGGNDSDDQRSRRGH